MRVDAWQSASALYVQTAGESSDAEAIEISLEGSNTPVRFLVAAREPDLVLVRPDYGVQYRMNLSAAELLSPNSATAPDDES